MAKGEQPGACGGWEGGTLVVWRLDRLTIIRPWRVKSVAINSRILAIPGGLDMIPAEGRQPGGFAVCPERNESGESDCSIRRRPPPSRRASCPPSPRVLRIPCRSTSAG